MSQSLAIACIDMPERDTNYVESLLTFLRRKLKHNFEFSDESHADLLFIKVETDSGMNTWKSRFKRFPAAKYFIAISAMELPDADRILNLPIRPPQLLDALNEIGSLPARAIAKAMPGSEPHLFEHIFNTERKGQLKIHADHLDCSPALAPLTIDFTNNRFYFSGSEDELKTLCQQPLTAQDIESGTFTPPPHTQPKHITQLLWDAGFSGSQGKPLEKLQRASAFKLLRWPELRHRTLPRDAYRVCALLTNHQASIEQIVELTHVERETVIGVLNACELNSALAVLSDGKPAEITRDQRRVGLVARIRQKLKL